MSRAEIRHFHMFCGSGSGARGFNRGTARVGTLTAAPRCIGGIDVDAACIRDFERLTGARGTVLDLFDREQFVAHNGREPGPDWREATPADIRTAAGNERPHIVFLSAPCKGFSGLLSEEKSRTDRYQALNRLTVRGVWLMLEAWADDPPELVIFENVPRLATRGRPLLDRITAMLRAYGYATAETTHDCGELGGLAQSRKRLLLVARHIEKVPNLLYEPARRPLRAVGDVLQHLPVPGGDAGGAMHRMPALAWKTWVRLAFVEAGSDWRSLNKLAVQDGFLRDFLIVPDMHNGGLGVRRWTEPCGTVQGQSRPSNGAFSVADPRFAQSAAWHDGQAYGVRRWAESTGAIAGQQSPGQGAYAVADPRMRGERMNNAYRVVRIDQPSVAVTSGRGAFGACVADPRQPGQPFAKYGVTGWDSATGTVIGGSTTGQGAFAVADPRTGMSVDRDGYRTQGHYGVTSWADPCGAVSAAACHDNGRWSVADPRLPAAAEHLVALIRALDGTWHRPFTTLELAALQTFFDPEDPVEAAAFGLDGTSHSAWREHIGNAVPGDSAAAIAGEMYRTLLLAFSGETFALSASPVWVRPIVAALQLGRAAA